MFSFLSKPSAVAQKSVYDFKMPGLDGKEIDFNSFRGKWLLIVNTASKCGYTPQYADLQKLHELYGSKIVVLGFPANDFLWQEPGSNQQIATFCEKNYGVTFQMFEKVSVKGSGKHPLFRFLESKTGKTPGWNFSKYLVGPDGEVAGFYASGISPLDKQIIDRVTK
jgi:glutathione peroxidase